MKKSLLLLILLFNILTPTPVFAHLAGQPPYLRINGKYTNLYPVPVSSLDNFNLPQDMAPETYTVGQKLIFTMEIDKLPAPPEIVKKTKFTWDFGDGTKLDGLSQTHVYAKPGSYFQIIYADDGSTPVPQLLSSALINVLPDKNYQLPTAVIKINNQQSNNPLTDILKFPLTENLTFDGSYSTSQSNNIISYFWDFGDQQSSSNAINSHGYDSDINQVFVVLRVKDSNGFIADSYVELQKGANTPAKTARKPGTGNIMTITTVLFTILILGGILFFLRAKRKNGQTNSRS